MTTATQEIVLGGGTQYLILDCEDGRPTSVTSVTVYAADMDDTGTAESATTGSPAVETNPNTTISAAAGPGNGSDPRALTLTSGTGVAIGRVYRITDDGTGVYEDFQVASVSGTSVVARHPLKNDYSSGSTVVSCRSTIAVDSTWLADTNNLCPAYSPNPGYRVVWLVVIGGETRRYIRYFDHVRYPSRHGVTPIDVDRAHPGWLDSLPPDYQADQGRGLIDRAFASLKFDLYGDGKADQAMRNAELVARLVIERCPLQRLEDDVMRGGGNADGLALAEKQYRKIYDQTLRSPVAAVDPAGDGASQPVRPMPLTRR